MAFRPKTPTKPAAPMPSRLHDAYVPGDVIPVPDVIEKDSDSVWAMWSDAVQGDSGKDDETQPATLLMGLPDLPKDHEA